MRVGGVAWRRGMQFWLGIFLACLALVGKGAGAQASLSEGELAARLTAILTSPPLSEAEVGVSVVRLADGKSVFSHEANRFFVPASNQKLLLSAAALGLLGSDFRFRTLVLSDAVPDGSGAIHGNLYLKGYGDPTFARSDFATFVAAMRKDGIGLITGDLVGDDSFFCGSPFGSGWLVEDLDKAYAAPASALCLEGNLLRVTVSPGARAGAKAKFQIEPASPLVSITNDCLTVKKGTRSWTSLSRLEGNSLRLSGRISAGHAPIVHVTTARDASLLTASVFAEMLKAGGIKLDGKVRLGTVPEGTLLLGTDWSPALSQILGGMNRDSDNQCAEQILRALGARVYSAGDEEHGAQAVSSYLASLLPGSPLPVIHDGSGLSPQNSMAPEFLAALLARLPHLPYWEAFVMSLPVAGVDGTLKRRLKGTPAEGKICGKTGTLTGVRALSGYVVRPRSPQVMGSEGAVLSFAILVNGFSCPVSAIVQAEDKICGVMWEYAAAL